MSDDKDREKAEDSLKELLKYFEKMQEEMLNWTKEVSGRFKTDEEIKKEEDQKIFNDKMKKYIDE